LVRQNPRGRGLPTRATSSAKGRQGRGRQPEYGGGKKVRGKKASQTERRGPIVKIEGRGPSFNSVKKNLFSYTAKKKKKIRGKKKKKKNKKKAPSPKDASLETAYQRRNGLLTF